MSVASSLPPEQQAALFNRPGFPPPNGILPSFDNPPNRNALGLGIVILCLVVATLSALMRAYSRLVRLKRVQFEDYLGLAAYGFFIGFVWTVLEMHRLVGFFVHQWDVRALVMVDFAFNANVLQILYCFNMLLAKTAVLLDWNRIFAPRGARNAFFWFSHAIILLNGGLYCAVIVALNLACRPREKLWYSWLPGECFDRRALDICTSSFNLIFDLCILFLPQRSIWILHMSMRRKIGISFIFSVGVLACIGAAGRVYTTAMTDYRGERTHGASAIALFGIMETTCVTLIFCIPSVPKIFADSTLLSRLSASLRSWTRLSRSRHESPSRSGGQSAWPQASAQADSVNNTYERITDDRQIPLSKLDPAKLRSLEAQVPQTTNGPEHDGNGILRVTEFSASEGSSTNAASADMKTYRQHPWMKEPNQPQ